MKRGIRVGVMGLMVALAGSVGCHSTGDRGDGGRSAAGPSEHAAGLIADTSFGSFQLNEKGTLRQFNLSSSKTRYEPESWRPSKGDEVKVLFTPTEGRRGGTVLAVDKLTLIKPGPDTVVNLDNPVVVEIVEVGASGVRAKLPKGQVIKFNFGRDTKRLPSGWVIAAGERARITFQIKPNRFSGASNYAIDQIEKLR